MHKVLIAMAVFITLACLPTQTPAVLWLDDDGEFQISIVEVAGREFADGFGTGVMRLMTLASGYRTIVLVNQSSADINYIAVAPSRYQGRGCTAAPFATECNRLQDTTVKAGEAAVIQFRYTDGDYAHYKMWVGDSSGKTGEFFDLDTSRGVITKEWHDA